MATKSERFRYWTERSGPKKPKRPRRPRRDDTVDTSKPGVSATDRRAPFPRKPSPAVAASATHAFEPAAKPSRKSTRKANARQRTDRKMQAKRRAALMSPGRRAKRRGR